MVRPLAGLLLVVVAGWCPTGRAHDLHVSAGRLAGDGSRARPFATLEQALERAVRGDVIHVTQGDYHGVLRSGVLPVPDLVLLGGYDAAFRERDPFRWPSRLGRDDAAQVPPVESHAGMVRYPANPGRTILDGFVFDGTTRNRYEPGAFGSLLHASSPRGALVHLSAPELRLANCVFLNAPQSAIRIEARGTSVENCLVLNAGLYGIEVAGDGRRGTGGPVLLRNNTVLFTWRARLRGGDAVFLGPGIETRLERNLFGYNQGVAVNDSRNFHHAPLHVLHDNAFFQNAQGHYLFLPRREAGLTVVDEPSDLTHTDLARATGNRVVHPAFVIEAGWFDRWADAVLADGAAPGIDVARLSEARERSGLPPWYGVSGSEPVHAPAYPLDHAMSGAFFAPRVADLEGIGVRSEGPFPTASSGGPSSDLPARSSTFRAIVDGEREVAEERVSFLAWTAGAHPDHRDVDGRELLPGADPAAQRVVRLRDVPRMASSSDVLLAFLRRGSAAERAFEQLAREPGHGVVEHAFLVVGTLRRAGGLVPRGAFVLEVEQIRPAPPRDSRPR